LLSPKETQKALFEAKRYIEDNLCQELKLMMVEVSLIVDEESGVNDLLDRNRSRTPIAFHISSDHNKHPDQCAGGACGQPVERDGAETVRHAAGRGNLYRHARCAQRLLPRQRCGGL